MTPPSVIEPGLARLLFVLAVLFVDAVAAAFVVPLVLADLRTRRLPDVLTLSGTATVLALLAAGGAVGGDLGPLGRGVVGGVAMAGVLLVLHLARPSGMGFGDVKLGLLLGVVVGWQGPGLVLLALAIAGMAGSVAGLGLMIRHRRRDVTLPFGPFLAAGAAAAAVVGML